MYFSFRRCPTYGLSSWGGLKIAELVGGYYPAMPQTVYADFANRFRRNFSMAPSPLTAFAYEAVSLGIFLGTSGQIPEQVLTVPQGYNGINGRFRLNSDGTNSRLLDMKQIKYRGRSVVVENAPSQMPL